ncbi:uncharacterized protein LOC143589278, partial [Bidens hawaiensis]|uniref:uncharacterized protein LOC143589278 n=1 Tax=Bidens hawaiensis TaxID=980011 RepID=UPI00404A6BA5
MNEENLKIPVFDKHWSWSEMMENLLRAKQLWKLIDPGFIEPTIEISVNDAQRKKVRELKITNMQVKHYLYQAIDKVTFEQILNRSSSNAIWDSIKKRFAGNERVKISMLQKLLRDFEFEFLEMKNDETIPDYFGRVLMVSNQMKRNGETISNSKFIEKILRMLSEKYVYVVISIEESNNVDEMSIAELCHKLGHFSYECPGSKEANYVGFDENEEVMLMVESQDEEQDFMALTNEDIRSPLWFLDSDCSNHMCGIQEKFGCLGHVHVPKEKRTKFGDRSFTCVLAGVSEESKGYRLIDPRTMKVVVSKDVIFEEDKAWVWDEIEEK